MPRRPGTPCLHPGCPAIVPPGQKGRCEAHRKSYARGIDRDRGTATDRGYDTRWARFRRTYLNEHPLCGCGCLRPAVEIHHLQPVSGPDDPRFYDEKNMVGLTKVCHSRETMRMLNLERRKALCILQGGVWG